jgi:hypothetical protein
MVLLYAVPNICHNNTQEQIIDTFIYVLIMCTLRSRVFLILSILKLKKYTILCGKRTAASCNEFQERHFLLFFLV